MDEITHNEEQFDTVSEPTATYSISRTSIKRQSKPCDDPFNDVDFGYARSVEELNAALLEAEAERKDPTKWITSAEFHERVESKYTWLR
jgi:hypothetical protein